MRQNILAILIVALSLYLLRTDWQPVTMQGQALATVTLFPTVQPTTLPFPPCAPQCVFLPVVHQTLTSGEFPP